MEQDRVMASALGAIPFDLVLDDLQLVNLYTEEIYPAQIGITGGRIAHVSQPGEAPLQGKAHHGCKGRYAVPGLIDTHVHMESSMLTPGQFARAVVPHGTTTIVADPHEYCNVLGREGMAYCARASRDILLRVLFAVPSCVPSVLGLESAKEVWTDAEIAELLAAPGVQTLGEVMDYMGVIEQTPRMLAIVNAAKRAGKVVQGHIMDVTPRQLSAYMAAGVCSDHESRLREETKMKLRAGLWLECRHASNAKAMAMQAQVLAELGYPRTAAMCTDDREPDDLIHEGHIDCVVREAIRAGMPPIKAVQMATVNAAAFLGLADRGGLRPGLLADVVLLDSLDAFSVAEVFIGGALCAEGGKLTAEIAAGTDPVETRNTVNIGRALTEEDFCISCTGETVRLNTVFYHQEDSVLTTRREHSFPVKNGFADVNSAEGFATMAVFERHNATGNTGIAPVCGAGLLSGAVAGTVSHDCHNLFVIGKNARDMLLAANRLVETGGGFAAVQNGELLAEIQLPVAGLVSRKDVFGIAEEVAAMKDVLHRLGIKGASPVHFLTAFCLPVIPEIRLTDQGLVDTIHQVKLPLILSNG